MWLRQLKGTDTISNLAVWLLHSNVPKTGYKKFIDFVMSDKEQPKPPQVGFLLRRDLEDGS